MSRQACLAWVAAVVPLAVAGCVDTGAVDGSFEDADNRYVSSYAGDHERSHTFDVGAGVGQLRVALHYEVTGDFNVQLVGPSGRVDELSEEGVAEHKDEAWYTKSGPAEGQWQLRVKGDGAGAYAFGVYMD